MVPYAPPMRLCMRAPAKLLTSESPAKQSHPISLSLGAAGPVFRTPGRYRIWAELAGVDGNRVAFAEPYDLTVLPPDADTQQFAEELWSNRGAMAAIYLRHPLTDLDSWNRLKESVAKFGIAKKKGNSTASYLQFLSAQGWARQFQYAGDRPPSDSNEEEMRKRLSGLDATGLPENIRKRIEAIQTAKPEAVVSILNPADSFREQLPSNGLFSDVALDQPAKVSRLPSQSFHRCQDAQGISKIRRRGELEHSALARNYSQPGPDRKDRGIHGSLPMRLLGTAGSRGRRCWASRASNQRPRKLKVLVLGRERFGPAERLCFPHRHDSCKSVEAGPRHV